MSSPTGGALLFRFTMPVLDKADNPRRLVMYDDDSDMSSFSYPCSTVLDGVPGQVPSYRLSFPLHQFEDQSYQWDRASPLHQGGREFHPHGDQVVVGLFLGSSPFFRPPPPSLT